MPDGLPGLGAQTWSCRGIANLLAQLVCGEAGYILAGEVPGFLRSCLGMLDSS